MWSWSDEFAWNPNASLSPGFRAMTVNLIPTNDQPPTLVAFIEDWSELGNETLWVGIVDSAAVNTIEELGVTPAVFSSISAFAVLPDQNGNFTANISINGATSQFMQVSSGGASSSLKLKSKILRDGTVQSLPNVVFQ